MIPPCIQIGIYYYGSLTSSGGMGSRFNSMGDSPLLVMLPSAVGPFLLGLSLVFGFAALSPPIGSDTSKPSSDPQQPEKHPLD